MKPAPPVTRALGRVDVRSTRVSLDVSPYGEGGTGALQRLLGRHRSLAEDDRLRAAEIEDRRRRAGKLAHVDDGAAGFEDLPGDVLAARWVGPAMAVRARRRDGADAPDDLERRRRQRRHADADRLRPRPGEPAEAARRVGEDKRERAWDEATG